MPLSEETLQKLEIFIKAAEDLMAAKFEDAFLYQSGEIAIPVGTTTIPFNKPYDSDYIVNIHSATDGEYEVKDALKVIDKTNNGFKINTPVACTVKWEANRTIPQLRLWT